MVKTGLTFFAIIAYTFCSLSHKILLKQSLTHVHETQSDTWHYRKHNINGRNALVSSE